MIIKFKLIKRYSKDILKRIFSNTKYNIIFICSYNFKTLLIGFEYILT